ncbi:MULTISPECIES: hypothetical protein [Ruegeria]|uniref:hypothetical protein n=1 Tax=Ruegeria TaxID=97050 RepID=UPI00147A9109|nr:MULTISPECIES: hypothetical protein [Ruegeria]
MTTPNELGPHNAIWLGDGEWISWDEINWQIQCKEWRARYPNARLSLVPIFEQLLDAAAAYYDATGSHLQVYGDIGELYGAITYGLELHRNYAQGSDGRMGNDFVEVKTITPFKNRDEVVVNMDGNFSKLLVVRINEDFDLSHKLVDRKDIPKRKGKVIVKWADM